MRVWRWLLVIIVAPSVFMTAVAVTLAGGGVVTGLAGVNAPFIVFGVALVIAVAAVYKSGGMILN